MENVPEIKPYNEQRSARTGRLSLGAQIRLKEKENPHYKDRIEGGRAQLARSLNEFLPDSLSKLRLQKGFSQTSLASVMGTSQSHIARIEAGSVKVLFETAIRLADALAVSIEQLKPLILNESDIKPSSTTQTLKS